MAIIDIKVKSHPYPILTVTQFHEVTGKSIAEINRKISSLKVREQETYLDIAYPFTSKTNAIRNGLKFVVLNQKGLEYIRKCIIKPKVEYSVFMPDEEGNPGTVETIVQGKDLSDMGLLALVHQMIVYKSE